MDIFKAVRSAKLEKVQEVIAEQGTGVLAQRNDEHQTPRSYLAEKIQLAKDALEETRNTPGDEDLIPGEQKRVDGLERIKFYLDDLSNRIAMQCNERLIATMQEEHAEAQMKVAADTMHQVTTLLEGAQA